MKKILYLTMMVLISVSMASCGDDDPPHWHGGDSGGNEQPGGNDNLDITFTANESWVGYYGDQLGNGNGIYLIEICNGGMDDDGFLTQAGTAITLLVSASLPTSGTITLPLGEYKTGLSNSSKNNIYNTPMKLSGNNESQYYSFVEIKEKNNEDSYFDFIDSGTMTVSSIGNGEYKIECVLDMYYYDDNDNKVADGTVTGTYIGKITVNDYSQPSPSPDPGPDADLKFNATEFWSAYYGDYLGNGTGFYLIEINDGTIDDEGYLTSSGNAITLAVSGAMPAKGQTVTLPVGTYKTGLSDGQDYNIYHEPIGDYFMTFVEYWPNGEQSSYFSFIKEGTMTVTNNGDKYTIECLMSMYYYDDDGNEVDDGKIYGKYTGKIAVNDNSGGTEPQKPYETIPWNVDLGTMSEAQGAFYLFTKSQLANYYITLFNAPVDWEKDIFTGTGYAMTIDLYTDYSETPDLKQLNGTFKVATRGEYEEGTYQPGEVIVVANEPNWDGTYIDEIAEMEDEDGKYYAYGRSSMITGGTIEGTSNGKNVTLKLSLQTETGNSVVGTYSGELKIDVPENYQFDATKMRKAPCRINKGKGRGARKIKTTSKTRSLDSIIKPFSKFERNSSPRKSNGRRTLKHISENAVKR